MYRRGRQIQDGKRLERPSWRIVRKILRVLKKGKTRKSHLVMDCRMNHTDCNLYLEFLEELELVRHENGDSDVESKFICITERGRYYYSRHFGPRHTYSHIAEPD